MQGQRGQVAVEAGRRRWRGQRRERWRGPGRWRGQAAAICRTVAVGFYGFERGTDDLVDELHTFGGISELTEHRRREVLDLEARDALTPVLALHVRL